MKDLALKAMTELSDMGCRIWYGKGRTHASIVIVYDGIQASTQLLNIYPWKKAVYAEIYFQYFKAPFNTIEEKRILKERLDDILGITIPDHKLHGRPNFPFAKLLDPLAYRRFLETIQHIIDGIKALEREHTPNRESI